MKNYDAHHLDCIIGHPEYVDPPIGCVTTPRHEELRSAPPPSSVFIFLSKFKVQSLLLMYPLNFSTFKIVKYLFRDLYIGTVINCKSELFNVSMSPMYDWISMSQSTSLSLCRCLNAYVSKYPCLRLCLCFMSLCICLRLYISTPRSRCLCLYAPVSTSRSLRLYFYIYVSTPLYLRLGLYVPVFNFLSLHSSLYITISNLYLCVSFFSVSVSTSQSLRFCPYTYVSTSLSLRLWLSYSNSVSTSLSLRLYFFLFMKKKTHS